MSLEAANFINQLVPSNPSGADSKGQGDDHLRLIKQTLVNTFPNITGQVRANQQQLDLLTYPGVTMVRGMVILWSGYVRDIPAGWRLCDGQEGTPSLINRFVIGAGNLYGEFSYGGSEIHRHGVDVRGTALTVAQLPPHTHGIATLGDNINYTPGRVAAGGPASFSGISTESTGFGDSHTHTAVTDDQSHMPPYFALCYIMKL